jgi:hypothetical protein|tara:strand:- start:1517 stop:1900 length:384 start_codon:yes stop_codon:yes gene_type:complete
MALDKTNNELVRELLEAFSSLKKKMEDPNYVQIEATLKQLIDNQSDMKEDVSELKKRLLNPFDGAIVEIRKNTDFRRDYEKSERDLEKMAEEHRNILKWKSSITKLSWAILTSLGAVGTWLLSKYYS